MIRGNKGEWSELYVLLNLLAYSRIYAADDNLNRIEEKYFPILNIIREEIKNEKYVYYTGSEESVAIYHNDEFVTNISKDSLRNTTNFLYQQIIGGKDSSFEIDGMEEYMKGIYCTKLTAPSSDKTDITMQIKDINAGSNPICGFSIKSELGNPPTLLNASRATNFKFRLDGIAEEDINRINAIDSKTKIKDRINQIYEISSLQFDSVINEIFSSNLMLLDSKMEEIVAAMLLISYKENIFDCEELVERLECNNPLNYPKKGFYRFKIKKLLCSVALGMMPSKEWDGVEEANGGYIVVTKSGDVLAYHIYNRNFFEDYLLKNTKLDRGSSNRHGYASLYKEEGRVYIDLNLQIRFK